MRLISGKHLCLMGLSLVFNLTVPALAQTPPARTYQPGYWQPIARVNPTRPVTVMINNQTGSLLKFNYLDEHGEYSLPVGASKQLNNVPLPANIAIYNPTPQPVGSESSLRYETSVVNNTVQINIQQVRAYTDAHVINITKTGAIYLY